MCYFQDMTLNEDLHVKDKSKIKQVTQK